MSVQHCVSAGQSVASVRIKLWLHLAIQAPSSLWHVVGRAIAANVWMLCGLIERQLHCNVLILRTWITTLNSQMTVLGAQSTLCCMLPLLAIVLMYTNSAYHGTVTFDWIYVNAKVICEWVQTLENFVIMAIMYAICVSRLRVWAYFDFMKTYRRICGRGCFNMFIIFNLNGEFRIKFLFIFIIVKI